MIQPLPEDPEDFIRASPRGTVIYGFSQEEGKTYIDFLVRESNGGISEIPKNPAVEVRAGAVIEEGILIVTVLIRFAPEGPIYETFWNYHRVDYRAAEGNIFEHMCAEENLTFHFYNDEGEVADVIQVSNSMRPFFSDIVQQVVALRPWTLEEFDRAKQAVVAAYPTASALWDALGQSSRQR